MDKVLPQKLDKKSFFEKSCVFNLKVMKPSPLIFRCDPIKMNYGEINFLLGCVGIPSAVLNMLTPIAFG
jgi:hypothetical protein